MKSVASIQKKIEEYQNKLMLAQHAEKAQAREQQREKRKLMRVQREFAEYPQVELHRKRGWTHGYERALMAHFLDAGINVAAIARKFAVSTFTVYGYHAKLNRAN